MCLESHFLSLYMMQLYIYSVHDLGPHSLSVSQSCSETTAVLSLELHKMYNNAQPPLLGAPSLSPSQWLILIMIA